mgnify:CR=1 FL=1
MSGPTLVVDLVTTDATAERRWALAGGLARRLRADGDFAARRAEAAGPDGARGDEVELGCLLVEWGQAIPGEVVAGAAGAVGTKVIDALVAAVRGWLGSAGPEVTTAKVAVAEGVEVTIAVDGAEPAAVAAAARAYTAALERGAGEQRDLDER